MAEKLVVTEKLVVAGTSVGVGKSVVVEKLVAAGKEVARPRMVDCSKAALLLRLVNIKEGRNGTGLGTGSLCL
jgi:hypothetical protein